MPDFTRYLPPGVYVEDNSDPIVTSTGLPPSVVAIIGPALGYQTATETLQIHSSTGTVLANQGIFVTAVTGPPAIAAPVVRKLDGTLLSEGIDYTFTVDSSGTGGSQGSVTTIQRISNSPNVDDGDTVTIAYAYADTGYYQPQQHTDYDTVLSMYGLPMVTVAPANPNASQVASPLSLAAKVAIENRAATHLTVATNHAEGGRRARQDLPGQPGVPAPARRPGGLLGRRGGIRAAARAGPAQPRRERLERRVRAHRLLRHPAQLLRDRPVPGGAGGLDQLPA